jgi:hypothetical protein
MSGLSTLAYYHRTTGEEAGAVLPVDGSRPRRWSALLRPVFHFRVDQQRNIRIRILPQLEGCLVGRLVIPLVPGSAVALR